MEKIEFTGRGNVVTVKDDGREGMCHVVLETWLMRRVELALLDDGRTVRVSQLRMVTVMVDAAAFARYVRTRGLLTLARAERLLKPGARVVFTQAAKQLMAAQGRFSEEFLESVHLVEREWRIEEAGMERRVYFVVSERDGVEFSWMDVRLAPPEKRGK